MLNHEQPESQGSARRDLRDSFPAPDRRNPVGGSFTYPKAWAEAQDRLPCRVGSGGGDAIYDLSVTFEQFAADPRNHYSVTGCRFTDDDLRALWRCVLRQRMEMQALWLVAQGRFLAINPARDFLLRELGEFWRVA